MGGGKKPAVKSGTIYADTTIILFWCIFGEEFRV